MLTEIDVQNPRIEVYTAEQRLLFYPANAAKPLCDFLISTAKNGLGEVKGSFQTPRGLHRVCAKFGGGFPKNTVLRTRQPTGEYYSESLAAQYPERDWILSRILWLEGLEVGKNKGGDCDTRARYIYVHGVPDSCPMGVPESHGCIRMRNEDIITLYPLIPLGTLLSVQT